MRMFTRRAFARAVAGGAAFARSSSFREAPAQPPLPPADFGFPAIGRVKPRPSLTITASPLSIGFETLDRKMFEPERTYGHLAELGVKWARCQTGWARTERAKGEYDFAWLDDVVNSLRKIGIRPWFNLGYGNRLYTPDAPHESAVGWAPIFTAEAHAAWLNYVRRIAAHFAGRVQHWEIWNEPNIRNFWQPKQPNAADYVELVKITAPEIRKCVPKAVIVGGAIAGMPKGADFLSRCMELGLGDLIDKASYHPYRPVPELNYESEVRALRAMLAKHKPGLEIWQGENGCPSEKGGAGALADLDWNETRQAKWLLRRILSDLRLGIELTSYFHTVDMVNYVWSSGQSGKTNFKGILRGNTYTRKPAYDAYQCVCALFDSETRRTDLCLQAAKVLSQSGGDEKGSENTNAICAASFARSNRPLHVYWRPADLQKGFGDSRVGLRWTDAAGRISNPVLVDPLTAQVYALDRVRKDGVVWTLESAPLLDHPLIVTDSAAVG